MHGIHGAASNLNACSCKSNLKAYVWPRDRSRHLENPCNRLGPDGRVDGPGPEPVGVVRPRRVLGLAADELGDGGRRLLLDDRGAAPVIVVVVAVAAVPYLLFLSFSAGGGRGVAAEAGARRRSSGGAAGISGCCGRGLVYGGRRRRRSGGRGEDVREPVLQLPEAGGADGVPVPVRRAVLRRAPVLGPARLQLRLQGRRQGRHRPGEPGGARGQDR